jgi:hypothetical protein
MPSRRSSFACASSALKLESDDLASKRLVLQSSTLAPGLAPSVIWLVLGFIGQLGDMNAINLL